MEFSNGAYHFPIDIHTGEKGEKYIIDFMVSLGFSFIEMNKDNRWDFKMSYKGKEYTYEAKTDVYKKDTGNMVIEFECRGKASGINVTQADFFVYFFPFLGEIWTIKCSELKKLIEDTKPHIFEAAGDKDSNTRLYRLKKKDVSRYFKLHKIKPIIL